MTYFIAQRRKAARLNLDDIHTATSLHRKAYQDFLSNRFFYIKSLYEIRYLQKNIDILEAELEKIRLKEDKKSSLRGITRKALDALKNIGYPSQTSLSYIENSISQSMLSEAIELPPYQIEYLKIGSQLNTITITDDPHYIIPQE
jgi:hypothetical protein